RFGDDHLAAVLTARPDEARVAQQKLDAARAEIELDRQQPQRAAGPGELDPPDAVDAHHSRESRGAVGKGGVEPAPAAAAGRRDIDVGLERGLQPALDGLPEAPD